MKFLLAYVKAIKFNFFYVYKIRLFIYNILNYIFLCIYVNLAWIFIVQIITTYTRLIIIVIFILMKKQNLILVWFKFQRIRGKMINEIYYFIK